MAPKLPSMAMAGCTEVRGRSARKQKAGEKRAECTLGKVGSGKKERKGRLTKEEQKLNEGERQPAAKVQDLRHWFERKGRGNSSFLGQETGGGKASGPETGAGKEGKAEVGHRLEPAKEK